MAENCVLRFGHFIGTERKAVLAILIVCLLSIAACKTPMVNIAAPSALQLCSKQLFSLNNSSVATFIAPSNMTPINIKVGFLTSLRNKGSGMFYGGAFFLAIDELNRQAANKSIPITFDWEFSDISNHEAEAMRKMVDLYCSNNVSAFIGPDVYCKPAGLMATAFNIPYIAFNCEENHNDFGKHMMVSAEPTLAYISRFIVSVLRYYKWKSFWLVSGSNIKWQTVAEQLRHTAEDYNISINGETENEANDEFSIFFVKERPYKSLLQESRHMTRVYVYLGDYESLLLFLRELKEQGMTDSGEYAVVAADDSMQNHSSPKFYMTIQESRNINTFSEEEKRNKLLALRNVLIVKPEKMDINKKDFEDAVFNKNVQPPINLIRWHHEAIISTRVDIPNEAYQLYDATMIYGKAVMALMARPGADPKNASQIIKYIRCRYHDSITGKRVWIHGNGETQEGYVVESLALDESETIIPRLWISGSFSSMGYDVDLAFQPQNPVLWVKGQPPVSDPECGFDGQLCISHKFAEWKVAIIIASVLIFVIIIIVILILGIRHYMYEQKLERLAWKIEQEEIQIINNCHFRETTTPGRPRKKDSYSGNHLMSPFLLAREPDPDIISDGNCNSDVIPVGVYRGTNVVVRQLMRKNLELTRSLKKQLQIRKEMTHENINRFIGACIETPYVYMVTQYCQRKSLQDILRNEDSQLDDMFITSLVQDLIRGMTFIHDSEIGYHGNLKSSNCLVDSRWTLKITDFGLSAMGFPPCSLYEDEEYFRGLLWTAPELLRYRRRRHSSQNSHHPHHHGSLSSNSSSSNSSNFITGSQKGDVYSFGIILYELYGKSGPWGNSIMTNKEIIESLLNRTVPVIRPSLSCLKCDINVVNLIQVCWDDDPNFRPDFKYGIRTRFKPIQQGLLKSNIFDNMLAMMEKYANNLEAVVAARTEQLRQEKRMTENLLLRMLPRPVAEKLKRGHRVEPEQFEQVSIYFSDIVGFTELSADSTPMEVVDLLNDLYTCFDSIIEEFDVYKVETIGDAYMVVSGLPIKNGDRHAGEIASMSLLLLEAIKQKRFRIRGTSDYMLKIRIGIHSGPCCAGVVGLKMPRYCLFGDTVNTANRIESTGEALKIHCSDECKKILDKLGGYHLEERGYTEMKGKGSLLTHFLQHEDEYNRYKRMSRYKRTNSKSKCVSSSNQDTGLKICYMGEKSNSLLSQQFDTTNSTANNVSYMNSKNEVRDAEDFEGGPRNQTTVQHIPAIIHMYPIAEDPVCGSEGTIGTISYCNSFLNENHNSETDALLTGYGVSYNELSTLNNSNNHLSSVAHWDLEKSSCNQKCNGSVICQTSVVDEMCSDVF